MINFLNNFFGIEKSGSTIKTECLAGLTSFMAMCYLIFVIPEMLSSAGMPKEAATNATIWIAVLSTILMGIYANFPVGVAPGLGITAFFAYYVCGPAGFSWQEGLGAVFVSGCLFLLLTITRIRQLLIDSVPIDMKYAIVVGIGAFIAFIGFKTCGLVVADSSTFVTLGKITAPECLLAITGIFIISGLMIYNVQSAMLLGIFIVTILGWLLGITPVKLESWVTPEIGFSSELFFALDFSGVWRHGLFAIVFTLTMVDLFDSMGVLIGLAQKAGFIAPDGKIKNLDKALVVDSIATMGSAVLGVTTATSYLESAAGVATGGKTGLTAVVTGLLFFLALFFTPLVGLAPAYATAPVLIVVGALMMQEVVHINFKDPTIALPAFLTIISMPLTFNIATGFGFGFISYVILKVVAGKIKEINWLMCVIAFCFVLNFALRT